MPINIKYIYLSLFFLISTYDLDAGPNRDGVLLRVVSDLEIAMKEKNIDSLQALVSPSFSVSVTTLPGSLRYVDYIFHHIPELDSIRVLPEGMKRLANGEVEVNVAFYQKDNKREVSKMRLDSGLKICYIDYFDRLYGLFRERPSKLQAIIPFEFENNAIMINLKINDSGRLLRFLFDTGADGMAISKQLADSVGLTISREQNTSVVGTNRNVSISSGNVIHLDTLSIGNQNIAIFEDMGNHDGIIGLNLAKAFIVKVDFKESKLYLFSMGDYTPSEDEISIPITVPDGIIRIPSTLDLSGKGSVSGNFVFDTGAGFHVVAFSPFVRRHRLLLGGFKYESQSSMMSLGHVTQIYHGKTSRFSFGGLQFEDLPIALQASSGGNDWDPGAAGSIGIHLIKKYNFTIDLVKKQLYLDRL